MGPQVARQRLCPPPTPGGRWLGRGNRSLSLSFTVAASDRSRARHAILVSMEKKKGRVAASLEKSDPAPAAAVPGAVEEIADLPWKLTWFVLGLLFLSLVWYPVSKISAH